MARASSPERREPGAAFSKGLVGITEPRIFTPPLRELTPDTSLGFAAIDFAERVCREHLMPWQKWLLIHMLELREDGTLRFRTCVVLVARQNGKSKLSNILSLFFMYVLHVRLIIGTAQDLDVAEEIWQDAVDLVDETPALARRKGRVFSGSGKKALFLTTGERYKVKAANRKAGRGLTGDLILLDELREHTTWQAWSAVTKTTMAREQALVVALSNAGDVSSVVLRHLRKMAHQTLGDPDGIVERDNLQAQLLRAIEMQNAAPVEEGDEYEADLEAMDEYDEALADDALGLFEWSAAPGCSVWDKNGWAQANPSLGHLPGFNLRNIAAAAKTDPEWEFRTEVLCQWPDGALAGVLPAGTWEATTDAESRRADGARVVYGIDTSADRQYTHISVAALREDGTAHVEVVATRAGTDWVRGWFLDDAHPERRERAIAGQGRGAPVSGLLEELGEILDDWGYPVLRVVPWQGDDLQRGCGMFHDAVRDSKVFHRPAPILDVAVAVAATRKLGDGGWVWDRRGSATDIAGLVSATAAYWLLIRQLEEEPVESEYELSGLEVV